MKKILLQTFVFTHPNDIIGDYWELIDQQEITTGELTSKIDSAKTLHSQKKLTLAVDQKIRVLQFDSNATRINPCKILVE